MGYLANNLFLPGKLGESEATARDQLARDRKVFGPGDRQVAMDLRALAKVLHAESKLPEAEAAVLESLEIWKKEPPSSPDGQSAAQICSLVDRLITLFIQRGRLREVENLERSEVSSRQKLYGNQTLTLFIALEQLAGTLQAEGRLYEAKRFHLQALAIGQKLPAIGDVVPDIGQYLEHNLFYEQTARLTNLAKQLPEISTTGDQTNEAGKFSPAPAIKLGGSAINGK